MSAATEYFKAAVESAQQTAAELSDAEQETLKLQAEALPLRRDMVTLLVYVRDNSVIGTQNTGNLPLKAVHEISARFVDPPKLEEKVGDHIYRVRSETDLWPLYYLHILADVGGLAKGAAARRWRVTRLSEKFLALDPWSQVVYLLATWWDRVDWVVAYPVEGLKRGLPPYFTGTVWQVLDDLPVDQSIEFEPFADRLVVATGLRWPVPDADTARMVLHGLIRRMLLSILHDFGAVTLNFEERPLGPGTIRDLVTFRLTSFGKQLLNALVL
jgi:hypothetical protein